MKHLLIALFLIIPASLLANGGPIDWSTLVSTGTVQLVKQAEVELLEEDLSIQITGSNTYIDVLYTLKSSTTQQVDYGFPIDFTKDVDNGEYIWQGKLLPFYQILLDGKEQKVSLKAAKGEMAGNFGTDTTLAELFYSKDINIKRRWLTTRLALKGGQAHVLRVRYELKNAFSDWATSKSALPGYSKRFIYYDMSPASYWGKGSIQSFKATLDIRGVSDVQISPMGNWKPANGSWTWEAKNLTLDKGSGFSISYDASDYELSKYIQEHKLKPWNYSVNKVSSVLGDEYEAEMAFDGDFSTAWVEGVPGLGIGQTMEIDLDETSLFAIIIFPGYLKSEKTYKENAKPKRIKVELYASPEYTSAGGEFSWREVSSRTDLKDKAFQRLFPSAFTTGMELVFDSGDIHSKVKKIRLTILDAYPGSKYEDTCISEIILMGE